jgi:serine/threonine protein kinase
MTKLYFSIVICHGLRYLQEYKIAHLDIKPSNIMTFNALKLKIIDFGESYHPNLKSICSFI